MAGMFPERDFRSPKTDMRQLGVWTHFVAPASWSAAIVSAWADEAPTHGGARLGYSKACV